MSKNFNRGNLPYSVSQNFLTSRRLIEKLIKKAGLTGQDVVLEIGAGKAAGTVCAVLRLCLQKIKSKRRLSG